jgi:hypothetical protein
MALERYAADGVYSHTWAWSYLKLERLVRLAILEMKKKEQDRINAGIPCTPQDPETRLFSLMFEKWSTAAADDAERQARACEALRIDFPFNVPFVVGEDAERDARRTAVVAMAREKAAELVQAERSRPWCWPHEPQPIGAPALPVVIPWDWNGSTHVDVYDVVDERWTPGETVVVPVDELPVEAEPAPSRSHAKPVSQPRAALDDGIPEAEIVEDVAPDHRSAEQEDTSQRRSGGLVSRGGWRTIGHLVDGEFRPDAMDTFSF